MAHVLRLAVLLIILLAPAIQPALAREEILDYASRIRVHQDASLTVTETIRVRAEGRNIRRGIYRDFPLHFRYDDGTKGAVGFKVLEVLRDGRPENWFRKNMRNHARIYIGRKDTLLPPGIHTYTIRYRTTRQIRYFADHDELYWNVTGNFWSFPILKARVHVRLPEGGRILRAALYTGAYGATGKAAARRLPTSDPREFAAETTAPLGPREGFTIAIAFPKGVVAEPTALEKRLRKFLDDLGYWWLIVGAIGVTGYFLWAWWKVGRDPAPGAIYPRWEPPMGLSPAATAWLEREARPFGPGWQRAFIAALVSLATKGLVRIEERDGRTHIVRLKKPPADLPPGERVIMEQLLTEGVFTIERGNHEALSKALSAFGRALDGEYENVFIIRNRLWFIAGAVLAALVAIGFFALSGDVPEEMLGLIFAGAFVAGLGFAVWQTARSWNAASMMQKIVIVVVVAMFLIPFFAGLGDTLLSMLMSGFTGAGPRGLASGLALLSLPLVVAVFWLLLPRPTDEGRRALDELEGLKMFLKTAESGRLNMPGAPRMSISTFERFLPYAIALGLEKPWTKAFQAWLASALAAGATYQPQWYGGRSFDPDSVSDLGGGLVSGISSDMAAAMPQQSASGSSGGGFSGGGGGGGGGGGW